MQIFDTTTRAGATVLAALRYYQANIDTADSDIEEIATCCDTVEPLDENEIDELAEALNCGGAILLDGLHPGQGGGRTLPAIAALAAYLEKAPAAPVGEGDWQDIQAAYDCGRRQESSEAAQLIRGGLLELGLPVPAGVPVCEGCGLDLADGEHADDCTVPIWAVTLTVPCIEVTASNASQAERYARSDLGDCKGWRATVDECERGTEADAHGDIEGPSISCTKLPGGMWNCEAEYSVAVRAKDEAAAEAAALAELSFDRMNGEG